MSSRSVLSAGMQFVARLKRMRCGLSIDGPCVREGRRSRTVVTKETCRSHGDLSGVSDVCLTAFASSTVDAQSGSHRKQPFCHSLHTTRCQGEQQGSPFVLLSTETIRGVEQQDSRWDEEPPSDQQEPTPTSLNVPGFCAIFSSHLFLSPCIQGDWTFSHASSSHL